MTAVKQTTREQVGEFHTAFRAPIRTELTSLSVSECELRCKLLLEEVLEFISASGFRVANYGGSALLTHKDLTCIHIEGSIQDPIEMADGLGDINYIIHGTAHCMGIDLDAVTTEIHDSNMSKLDRDGTPIINQCETCHGRNISCPEGCGPDFSDADGKSNLTDSNQPIGKILKGPNYRKPDIARVIGIGNGEETSR